MYWGLARIQNLLSLHLVTNLCCRLRVLCKPVIDGENFALNINSHYERLMVDLLRSSSLHSNKAMSLSPICQSCAEKLEKNQTNEVNILSQHKLSVVPSAFLSYPASLPGLHGIPVSLAA